MAYNIEVSDHAYWRAAERFPGFLTERIGDEVALALAAGRVGIDPPPGVEARTSHEDGLWAWTPDGVRVYALRVHRNGGDSFVVVTVVRATVDTVSGVA